MKKIIQKIRAAKTWQERARIAQDKLPGTSFDQVFEHAQLAKDMATKYRPITRQCHERLGEGLASIILNGKTQVLHDMAAALGVWKRHRPKPNFELIALFSMSGMFPPGWTKTWGKDASGKLAPGYTPVAPGTRDIIAMRDIKASLARHDPNFNEGKWESSRRKIQRYAKEFKIPLDDTPGCPPKKTRQDSRKKL